MLFGLGHVDLVCCDVDASLAFYAAVFGPLGLEPPFGVPGERGETEDVDAAHAAAASRDARP